MDLDDKSLSLILMPRNADESGIYDQGADGWPNARKPVPVADHDQAS